MCCNGYYYYYYYYCYYYCYYINIMVIIIIIIVIATCTLTSIRHFERTHTILFPIYRSVPAHHSVARLQHSHDLEFLMKTSGPELLLQAIWINLLAITTFSLKLTLKAWSIPWNRSKLQTFLPIFLDDSHDRGYDVSVSFPRRHIAIPNHRRRFPYCHVPSRTLSAQPPIS